MTSDADDPRLAGWLGEIWRDLGAAAAERRGDFVNATLASVNEEGGASLRIVVLRAADRETGRLSFHTDARSRKVPQLLARPLAELLFWRASDGLQLRCAGPVKLYLPGTPEATAAFEAIPEKGRGKYRTPSLPGTAIPNPVREATERPPGVADPGLDHFTLGVLHLRQIDALRLDGSAQTRALFRFGGTAPAATWLVP